MAMEFNRIITLLRKERGITQKQAAQELGISQAQLSHYEKGIRECRSQKRRTNARFLPIGCLPGPTRRSEPLSYIPVCFGDFCAFWGLYLPQARQGVRRQAAVQTRKAENRTAGACRPLRRCRNRRNVRPLRPGDVAQTLCGLCALRSGKV